VLDLFLTGYLSDILEGEEFPVSEDVFWGNLGNGVLGGKVKLAFD
jgi:hypothetical protein